MSIFKRDQTAYRSPPVQPATARAANGTSEAAAPEPIQAVSEEPAVNNETVAAVPAQPRVPSVNRAEAAIIDCHSQITGTLHSQGNVLVEGHFEGEIEAKETVWIEKGAETKAQLRAKAVIVAGSFDGEITCERRLHITSTATISGEINTPVLVIEEGSTVNCRFNMTRSGR